MPTPRERFVEALQFLHDLQQKGIVGISYRRYTQSEVSGNTFKKWIHPGSNERLVHCY
ncbi:hypothetical protein ACFP1I_32435 [Dyadobacter subterraneus]|uniref:Uncharacterized protein n=1 Tax=Dyadobacter subterraneus TaxID=2773304 RepID=A0ABR9WHT9_9BACT|nr:hypothetical protein [Dyadobacter subterraneus]MBE9463729.1 hypothetical protein [Dyadobacter subterraneus]